MFDEFQFLESDAKRVGRKSELPGVSRKTFIGESGRKISVLHYEQKSQGAKSQEQASPLVFLHGAGLNAHTFDPTILALEASAYSIDLPGHGKSDWRDDETYSPFSLAADVASVITQISSEKVRLVGHSLGGLTAAEIVAEHPEIIDQLLIIDITPGLIPNRDAGSISEFISGQKEFDTVDEIIDRAISFKIGHDRNALRRGITLNTRLNKNNKLEWTHHLAHLDGLKTTDKKNKQPNPFAPLWDPLETLAGNVALLRGTTGLVTDEMVSQWVNNLPEASVVTIEGGHNLHEHNPIKLAETIKKTFNL